MLLRLLADPEVTRVRSVARRELPAHPKLVHTRADLCDPAARAALDGVDVLWHLGFSLWRGGDGRRANLAGTANVLAAQAVESRAGIVGRGVRRLARQPAASRRGCPPRPNRQCAYAADKLECERRCLSGAAPVLVLRIGAVLGPHADPRVRRAVSGYRRAVPAVRGASEALQFLDEDDVAAALLRPGKVTPSGS